MLASTNSTWRNPKEARMTNPPTKSGDLNMKRRKKALLDLILRRTPPLSTRSRRPKLALPGCESLEDRLTPSHGGAIHHAVHAHVHAAHKASTAVVSTASTTTASAAKSASTASSAAVVSASSTTSLRQHPLRLRARPAPRPTRAAMTVRRARLRTPRSQPRFRPCGTTCRRSS